MDFFEKSSDSEDALTVFDINDVSSRLYLEEVLHKGSDSISMTSLSALMLLHETELRSDNFQDASVTNRLSLAYERLHVMPKILLQELSPHVKILDISHNEFENLSFLSDFPQLTTLICDHNNITSFAEIPYLPKLELLWMNFCKVRELYPWAINLQQSCPNLKYLSLMGNPAAPSYLNGGNFYDYLQYRYFMISLFPNLLHLDDRIITPDQREEAQRLYKRPIVEKMAAKTQNLPQCIRTIKNKVSNIFSPVPNFAVNRQRNTII
ncbi:leucine-rich melanocyte differentiation-associated protein [Holotrichia oblita]|uniref:Leucine-rich melanocyte differentiation-associated protein n=1 Tax=Holotrichia oblita TaxID=644536 RepID=A0ACB9SW37_HOLOL|nr:leucine-rich melanocyte differentiation-associated protein [Holotrichia oblita]